MQKKLILNADDYGWDKDATQGILQLIEAGKIHNVSILANHCSNQDFKAIQSYSSAISCGLHVCLNEGKPLFKQTSSSIQNEEGYFYRSAELFKKAILKKIKYADVYTEIKSQHNFLKEHGIEVTHADSHQHIHQYPFLSKMITHALHEVGIKKIRSCTPYSIYDTRRLIISAFVFFTKQNINTFKHPDILITDFTNKEFVFGADVQKIILQLNNSSYQAIEWMCHPALADRADSYLHRTQEYDFLRYCDWNDLLKNSSIELSQYRFL